MKRIGRLFDLLATRDNLGRAFHAAARGKRERSEVRGFAARLDRNLEAMGRELREGAYRFQGYRSFEVRDTKSRTIHAPSFRDRVAHHAMMGVVGPVLERGAMTTSFACRIGRGQHRALALARHWTRRTVWYGKMDVRKFYDSVRHGVLLDLLARRLRERRLLDLFSRLLGSYETEPGRGLPIGALTSQYLGNFMLDRWDQRMMATGRAARYLRYMDDAVWWGRREDLEAIRETATGALAGLGLELKNGGEWNRCGQGVPFLGFVIYPDRMRLGKAGRQRLRREFGQLERERREGLDEATLAARGAALFAHPAVADDRAWRVAVLRRHDFGEGQGPGPAGRLLEQHRQELPRRVSQQEQARQPEQEQRFPAGCGPRHGEAVPSTDDAPSRARPPRGGAETAGKTPPGPETPCGAWRKGVGGAPADDGKGGARA